MNIKDAVLYSTNPTSISTFPNCPTNFKINWSAYHASSVQNGIYLVIGSIWVGTFTVSGGVRTINWQGSPNVKVYTCPPKNAWYDLELTYEDGLWTFTQSDGLTQTLNLPINDRDFQLVVESNAQIKDLMIMSL